MKKRRIKSILWSCGLLLLVVFLACVPLLMELGAGASAGGPSIVSAQAEIGSIPTDLACAGSLCQQDSIEIDAPKGVMLRELLIEDGQHIAKDQILAKVDRVSVMSTIARVQQLRVHPLGQVIEHQFNAELHLPSLRLNHHAYCRGEGNRFEELSIN